MRKQQRPGQTKDFWLSKRPDGKSASWCRTWFDNATRQTRRASLGTDDFQEAETRLIQWVAANAEKRKESAGDVLLEELLIRYYQNHASKIASAEQARYALDKWSDFFAGATVSDLTPMRQEDFIAHLRESGASDGYVARTLTVGRAALNRAYKRQEITSVPFIMSVPGGQPRERRLSLEESAAFFNARATGLGMFWKITYCAPDSRTLVISAVKSVLPRGIS